MTTQVLSALNAVSLGLCLALVLFVPFVYVNYRRRGTLSIRHTVAWVATLIYIMALWTFTLLPFPDPQAIIYAAPQLTPFQFVTDFLSYDHGTPAQVLHNPVLWQVVFNLLLFAPLGFIAARLARRRFRDPRAVTIAVILGFATSLLIELTQLTGVWGVFAMAYRHFDVDDLMVNTTGAVGGALAACAWAALRRSLLTLPGRPRPRRPQIYRDPATNRIHFRDTVVTEATPEPSRSHSAERLTRK